MASDSDISRLMGPWLARLPIHSGWSSGIEPLPLQVVITGASSCSASDRSSFQAPELIVPPPAHISGRSASASMRAARWISPASPAGRSWVSAGKISTLPSSVKTSTGISTTTGRGRLTCVSAERLVDGGRDFGGARHLFRPLARAGRKRRIGPGSRALCRGPGRGIGRGLRP